MKKYKRSSRIPVNVRDLEPSQLAGHESEKFTDLAVAFRSQIGKMLHPGGFPEALKRLDVRQLLSVREFLLSPATEYLEKSRIAFIHWQALSWRMAAANDAFQVECLRDAERWRQDYTEDFSLDMQTPVLR